MGRRKSAATIARIHALNASKHDTENQGLEPTILDVTNISNTLRRTRNGTSIASLTVEITAKDTRIAELEELLAQAAKSHHGLEDQITLATSKLEAVSFAFKTLDEEKNELGDKLVASRTNHGVALRSLTNAEADLRKLKRRVKRVERERRVMKEGNKREISTLQGRIHILDNEIRALHLTNISNSLQLSNITSQLDTSKSHLEDSLETVCDLRQKGYSDDKQIQRLRTSLKDLRNKLKQLETVSTWSPTKSGIFTPGARKLYQQMKRAGCRNVELAIRACGEAFGVKVNRVMSRRTGSRAVKEGGYYGLIQLGREIVNAPAFGEGSDGTTVSGVTQESRSITLLAPSYQPGVDDSDCSTWKTVTRFAEVIPAIDHTAQRQFEGSMDLGTKIATAYSESLLATRDGHIMDPDDYFRKQSFQHMDHAKDGKKKFRLSKEKKEHVTNRDLAKEEMRNMTADDIIHQTSQITEAQILKAAGKTFKTIDEIPDSDRSRITLDLLEQRIGKGVFDSLPESEARLLRLFFFVGCGGHKALNAFCYGVVEMRETWSREGIEPPVNLANKATDVAIQIATDNTDTEALARCVASCPRGGVKLTELAGALFRHKNHETGYQEKHQMFMAARKQERYGVPAFEASRRFPDVSNTRYQSHSYAANKLIVYRDDYQELIEEITDGKTKPGANHLEGNALKGLQCAKTLCELGAMAVEGLTCSWPYMGLIRSPPEGEKFVDALSPEMITLHRRIPSFCKNLALYPEKLFDPNTPQDELTLDGQPFLDRNLIPTLKMLADELPQLNLMISSMFRGAAYGWTLFTPEYRDDPEDPVCIASLTPEMRTRLGRIPMTNDANEGPLGSTRVYIRSNPSSDSFMFSAQARATRNNTEDFISKNCTFDDQLDIMRRVRVEDASGISRKFREEYLWLQKNRAEDSRAKQAQLTKKKADELARLLAIGITLDRNKILIMRRPQLLDQFRIHKTVRKDPVLARVTQASVKGILVLQSAILAAASCSSPEELYTHSGSARVSGSVEAMIEQLEQSMEMDIDLDLDNDMDEEMIDMD